MEKLSVIERFGGVLKEEPVSCIENQLLKPDSCCLESVAPFIGYYSEVSFTSKPQYLYLPLAETYTLEKITRATLDIKKHFGHPFDAVSGTISLFGCTNQVIRIRNLDDYHLIATLQILYTDAGLTLKRRQRKIEKENAMIRLEKFFYLDPLGEGLYLDMSVPNHGYFVIPKPVEWDDFKQLTKEVKYEISLMYFDAATAFIFENRQITDLVRVYAENMSAEMLTAIRARYLHLLK